MSIYYRKRLKNKNWCYRQMDRLT